MDATTAVVTGGTTGIGRATAAEFAASGAHVYISGRDSDEVTTTISRIDGDIEGMRADVRDEYDVERLMESAAKFGSTGIDWVLPCECINHSSVGTPLPEESYAAFDDTLRTNTRGVFATIRESLPHLTDGGRVVVPTAKVARDPDPGSGVFPVSKAAAEALVRGFAADCDHVIGAIETEILPNDSSDSKEDEMRQIAEAMRLAVTTVSPTELDGQILDKSVI